MKTFKIKKQLIKSVERGYSGAKIASKTDTIYTDGKAFYIKPRGYERYLWFNPRQLI